MSITEKILRDKFKNNFLDIDSIESITEAMQEYAKAFAEWLDVNNWKQVVRGKWIQGNNFIENKTTNDLLVIFEEETK